MTTILGKLVYVVATLDRFGRIKDIGPEIFETEDSAWEAADALNARRQTFRDAGCTSVEQDFEVIKRRLLPY